MVSACFCLVISPVNQHNNEAHRRDDANTDHAESRDADGVGHVRDFVGTCKADTSHGGVMHGRIGYPPSTTYSHAFGNGEPRYLLNQNGQP